MIRTQVASYLLKTYRIQKPRKSNRDRVTQDQIKDHHQLILYLRLELHLVRYKNNHFPEICKLLRLIVRNLVQVQLAKTNCLFKALLSRCNARDQFLVSAHNKGLRYQILLRKIQVLVLGIIVL